jgi:hypothetical protein
MRQLAPGFGSSTAGQPVWPRTPRPAVLPPQVALQPRYKMTTKDALTAFVGGVGSVVRQAAQGDDLAGFGRVEFRSRADRFSF